MTINAGAGLTRLTIAASSRRVDLALPDDAAVADLLPGVLRAAGDGLADDGQTHGGWVLRRQDGTAIDADQTLGGQDVLDGEVLYLVSRQESWPELDYDDVVDAIATDARRRNRAWLGAATRRTGLWGLGVLGLLGAVLVVTLDGPWTRPAVALLGASAVLLAAAFLLARAMLDAAAGAVAGVLATSYAFLGGLLLLLDDRGLSEIDSTHVLVACCALFVAGAIGYSSVGHYTHYFVAAMVIAVFGLLGCAAAKLWDLSPADAAAVLAALVVISVPAYPLLSIRLGKLPVPSLPTSTEELLADPPHPSLTRVHATVKRSDEILTGLLFGSSITLIYCQIALVLSQKTSAVILTAILAVSTLLRGRLLPAWIHRAAVLIAGAVGLLALLTLAMTSLASDLGTFVVPAIAIAIGLAFLGGAIYFQSHRPTPYLGRLADILDVLLMLSVVPTACVVVGLVGYMRGFYG